MPIRKTPATSHFILIAGALQGETPLVHGGFLPFTIFLPNFRGEVWEKVKFFSTGDYTDISEIDMLI